MKVPRMFSTIVLLLFSVLCLGFFLLIAYVALVIKPEISEETRRMGFSIFCCFLFWLIVYCWALSGKPTDKTWESAEGIKHSVSDLLDRNEKICVSLIFFAVFSVFVGTFLLLYGRIKEFLTAYNNFYEAIIPAFVFLALLALTVGIIIGAMGIELAAWWDKRRKKL